MPRRKKSRIEEYQPLLTPFAILVSGLLISVVLLINEGGFSFNLGSLKPSLGSSSPTNTQATKGSTASSSASETFSSYAAALGLNVQDFDSCIGSDRHLDEISGDLSEAQNVGANGTPTFFVNGKILVGAQPYSEFKKALDAALNGETGDVTIDVAGEPVKGDPNAPVTLVEFVDYQCPFCERFFSSTLPAIQKDYIDTGKVKLIMKDLPLPFHQNAQKAAQAAHCAGDQGAYFKMHDMLMDGQGDWENLPTQ